MTEAWSHDHDECVEALANVHAFLHSEMSEAEADAIRHHLHACERCMDSFDIEATITAMLKRCCAEPKAPASLRVSITRTIIRRW